LVKEAFMIFNSDYLTDPPEPLSLRLQASLLVGVCRIYGQQYVAYCSMVEGFWKHMCNPAAAQITEGEVEKGRRFSEPQRPNKENGQRASAVAKPSPTIQQVIFIY
jgi:hypothetical protein